MTNTFTDKLFNRLIVIKNQLIYKIMFIIYKINIYNKSI